MKALPVFYYPKIPVELAGAVEAGYPNMDLGAEAVDPTVEEAVNAAADG